MSQQPKFGNEASILFDEIILRINICIHLYIYNPTSIKKRRVCQLLKK